MHAATYDALKDDTGRDLCSAFRFKLKNGKSEKKLFDVQLYDQVVLAACPNEKFTVSQLSAHVARSSPRYVMHPVMSRAHI